MQIRENYDKEVFNGDIGQIIRIEKEMQELTITSDGRVVEYDYSDLDELVLAYAVSFHKGQGSEYPCVVIPLLTSTISCSNGTCCTLRSRGERGW